MSVPVLAVLFTVFNAWGFYAGIPGTNINPTRTIGERFFGSLQLTSSIYALAQVAEFVHTLPDDVPRVGGDTYRHGSAIGDGQEAAGQYTDGRRIFVSIPPEAETSVATANASFTALPRQASDDKVYERRIYTVIDSPARPRGKGSFLDDPNNFPWIIVAVSCMFIVAMNANQGHARNGSQRDQSKVFDTLPETITDPIKKSADSINRCLKAIDEMTDRYEKLPLTDIRASSEKLSQTHVFVNDFQEKIQELIDLKKEENKSLLERALRDIQSLQKENKSLADRMSNVQGQLQVMQSQWKPQEDFGPRIDAVERLFEERLKMVENKLDAPASVALTTSVQQLDEKLNMNCARLGNDIEQLRKDTQSLHQDSARVDDVQQLEEKMQADIVGLQKRLEALQSDLDSRPLETAAKETPQVSDPNHEGLITQLQKDIESLQSEVKKHIYPTPSAPLSNQPGMDAMLRDRFQEFEKRFISLEMECQEKFSKIDNIVSMASARSSESEPREDKQGQNISSSQVIDSIKKSCQQNQDIISEFKKTATEMMGELNTRLANTPLLDQLQSYLNSKFTDINGRLEDISGVLQNANTQNIKQLTEFHVKELVDIKSSVDTLQKNTEERFAKIISSLDSLNLSEGEAKRVAEQLNEGFESLSDKVETLIRGFPTAQDFQDLVRVGNFERNKIYNDLTQLREDLVTVICLKADSQSVKQIEENINFIINHIDETLLNFDKRIGSLESERHVYSSEYHAQEVSRLENDLNSFHAEMEARLAQFQSKESAHDLAANLSKLCDEVVKLQKRMEVKLKDTVGTESMDQVPTQIALLKEEMEKKLAECNTSLESLRDDLHAKAADIEFAKSEIEKLNATGMTRTAALGSHSIQEEEFKELRVKLDATQNKIENLQHGQTVLERRVNPIIEGFSRNGVRLSKLEEKFEQEQRALRGVAKDVDQMLKLKKSDAPPTSAATESPKAEPEKPAKTSEEKEEPGKKESAKKEPPHPSPSSTKETPETKGPGLSASRWATDKPTWPELTSDEMLELSRSLSSNKRERKK
ncbi:hypothetical protein DTO027B5_4627 [Paecilomyces variotii]|nr:hypothetical protein DTO169C6_5837 [Paecilomyces variotii]KAJ9288448.1 hypothetical protein DTO021C3_3967 [Paecilomyces variotii]KAJ9320676.1 hypothetical protein DTO027B3_8320 [Paecilomyces variotii]KAJ9333640.1 hypothetical protein DTO027B5_4627 [Paecilomyces variotii]KAJ9398736.1 hypothetical protein DTO282F9_4319 [Paecilomyces variotii]